MTTEEKRALYRKEEDDATRFKPLFHRDSEFSVSSEYNDEMSQLLDDQNALTYWQGATLLTADCLGTGLLALPDDIRNLGSWVGFGFLILNLPINYYAGFVFHQTATGVEEQQALENRIYKQSLENIHEHENYESLSFKDDTTGTKNHVHHDTATFDFIGMSSALFHSKSLTRWVMVIFYINIFLVLGNYILVMSHAVSATVGEENICIPTAGIIASTAMFVVSQLRTMAMLGRAASIVSLAALAVVVVQCLWEVHQQEQAFVVSDNTPQLAAAVPILRKLSSLGGIGFAVGSQKLFLNIRHELKDRSEAPKTLGLSLAIFGTVYVAICWLAGPNAPSFLLDAIPEHTWNRRVAGFLLWMHVVVSYAINSQALCSSLDRLLWRRLSLPSWQVPHRWFCLTAFVSVAAYTIANAIPFFSDLVSLIGAVTTVPLTLLFPSLFFRAQQGLSLWGLWSGGASGALTYFALAFAVAATAGSLDSILMDWSNQKVPFACR